MNWCFNIIIHFFLIYKIGGDRRQAGFWLPLTCSLAVYLTSEAGLLATQVKSPECRESRLEMLRRLE